MKSFGGLWNRLLDMDNMLAAFHLAASGKRQVPEVRAFQRDLHGNLTRMIHELSECRYRFGPYRSFMIRDPKPRRIHVAPFEQRVMHHAIVRVVGPVLERTLIYDTYACRKGKGQHAAARRSHEFVRRYPWYLKLDVRKFYDRIEHARLYALLKARFRETRLHALFDALISSYATDPGRGLPIGNLTSQYFGNLYLDGLDHWVKEAQGMKAYVRYMDDMVVLGTESQPLCRLRDAICVWLASERGLEVKHGGEINRTVRGMPFVGFTLLPQCIRLQSRCAERYSRKLRRLKRLVRRGHCDETAFQERAVSLAAATSQAACKGFRLAVERRQGALWGYA